MDKTDIKPLDQVADDMSEIISDIIDIQSFLKSDTKFHKWILKTYKGDQECERYLEKTTRHIILHSINETINQVSDIQETLFVISSKI